MPSFPDPLSMVEALRAEYSDHPALVVVAGTALPDVTPQVIEGEQAEPGCWVHDGSDVCGYVGPDAFGVEVIAGLARAGQPVAVGLRSSESDGTVTVRAFDREALLCLSVTRVSNRLQDWKWWSEQADGQVTDIRRRMFGGSA